MASRPDPPRDPRPAAVTALRRPPVRQATVVRSDHAHTFHTFIATIGAWWPVRPFSAGDDQVRDVTVEPQLGGRMYESWADGTTVEWGRLQVWEPPHRFVVTWTFTPAPTEVELTFTSLGPGLTRVAVEHRGWEQLTEGELAADCAMPGGYSSGGYTHGWTHILACLAAAITEMPAPSFGSPDGMLTDPSSRRQ